MKFVSHTKQFTKSLEHFRAMNEGNDGFYPNVAGNALYICYLPAN